MRKVVWLMHVSLDGFVARESGEIDWILLEDEIFALRQPRRERIGKIDGRVGLIAADI